MKKTQLLFPTIASMLVISFTASSEQLLAREVMLAQNSNSESCSNLNLGQYRNKPAQLLKCSCPANEYYGSVWGTGTYTDDSSICRPTIHAGLLTSKDGGEVTIEIRPGQSSYTGSTRNGVTTSSWGAWGGSFVIVQVAALKYVPSSSVSCYNLGGLAQYRSSLGQAFTCSCPPNVEYYGSVWGTDPYTDDSSICRAALHAGFLTSKNGGEITIEISPGQSSYPGSTRNGITTSSWGPYAGSFTITQGRSTRIEQVSQSQRLRDAREIARQLREEFPERLSNKYVPDCPCDEAEIQKSPLFRASIAFISLMQYDLYHLMRSVYHPHETLFPRLASESG